MLVSITLTSIIGGLLSSATARRMADTPWLFHPFERIEPVLDNCTKHSNCFVVWSPRSNESCPVCETIESLRRELRAEQWLMTLASKRITKQQLALAGFDLDEVVHE